MSKVEEQTISVNIAEGPALQALQTVAMWHKVGTGQIVKLLENNKPGTVLALTGQDPANPVNEITLTDEMSRGFGIALVLALGALGNLPFELTAPPATPEVQDAEFEVVPE